MFERTLQDLIRGLRAHKASSKAQEEAFLAEAMVEIRDELRGKDMALKAEGVLKMCYVSGRIGGPHPIELTLVPAHDAVPSAAAAGLCFPRGGSDELAEVSLEA
jgi:hypothetical protein